MLVRHLCVLHVRFGCLELCIFLFDCLLYAPLAQLRGGTQKPHYYYYYYYYFKMSFTFALTEVLIKNCKHNCSFILVQVAKLNHFWYASGPCS